MDEFQVELDELQQHGVVPQTAYWEPRSLSYAMARGAHHNPDGSLTSENPSTSRLVTRISEVNEEVMQGICTSNRENDVLTQALGNKEHPSRTRGANIVPWKLAFEEESTSYWSRSRSKAANESEFNWVLKEMEANFEKRLEEKVEVRVREIMASRSMDAAQEPVLTSSVLARSSCGSTPVDNVEANAPHPVDNLTEPISVRLYVHQQWTTDKMVLSQAWSVGDGVTNGYPIPLGYAHVSIDSIVHKKYNKIHIDYPAHEDRKHLVENKGAHVAWRKRFIKLDDQLSSDDDDEADDESPPRDHEPSYHSPTPQCRTSPSPSPQP
jgi:hypothetical protein